MKILNQIITSRYAAYHGDSCEAVKLIPDNSIDYIVFSPPFRSLYTYSASERDMGNSVNTETFENHYAFLESELFRILKPGRLLSFHCMNLPTSKTRHGYIGIDDFRGDLIRSKQKAGFIFHSEVCIWKDPVTAMQRTKALGLLYKQLRKDAAMSRQGIPDYLVTMRKPGENPEPVTHYYPPNDPRASEEEKANALAHPEKVFPVDLWQQYASPVYGDDIPPDAWMPGMLVLRGEKNCIADNYPEPVWMDINQSDTLQFRSAREHNDERHICPLQLEVIRRGVRLWTNPNDIVFTPFLGIGSEAYVALQEGRRAVGCELKESYYKQAVANLDAVSNAQQGEMFPPDMIQRSLGDVLALPDEIPACEMA
jgi:hypothetical protein